MKNATEYEKKIKKLLSGMSKASPPEGEDRVRALIRSVFEADSTPEDAESAVRALEEEYLDYNELRVAQPKELVECVGRGHPRARDKAVMVTTTLNHIFNRTCGLSMEYMEEMTKRDLRRHLHEVGLDEYAAAAMVLKCFDGHAIPVDRSLAECLQMDDYAHPESDVADVQGFLERVISQKDALSAHELFREYVRKSQGKLEKKRQADREAAEKAAAEAEEKARIEKERAAAEQAEKEQAEKEKAQKVAEKKKAAARKKRKAKKPACKSASKSAKKSAKKPARKAKKKAPKKSTSKASQKKKKSSASSAGKSSKTSGSKATKAGKKSAKKSAGKSRKKSSKKSAKSAKKSGGRSKSGK